MKVCKICGCEFSRDWHKYIERTSWFCSKSCATKEQTGNRDREYYVEKLTEYILDKDRYCTLSELISGCKISSKSLVKYKVKVSQLNYGLGYQKPKSLFQEKVLGILEEAYGTVQTEVTLDGLVSPKGYQLRLDFYIPDLDIYVEADGAQHYCPTNPWYSDYNVLCDKAKDQFLEDRGLLLIRVPYKRKTTKDYVLNHLRASYTKLR